MNDFSAFFEDPYNRSVWIQNHWHSEPVCAWPTCETYLTREQMALALEPDKPVRHVCQTCFIEISANGACLCDD